MDLDARVAYWTWAWLNMGIAVGAGYTGIRHIRRRAVRGHQRRMLLFGGLVVLFLLSYPVKLALLGPEDLELWAPHFVWTLRVHELLVLTMVVSMVIAIRIPYKLGIPRGTPPESVEPSRLRPHRRAGWVAALSGAGGLLTAAYVLFGMYDRL